MGLSRRFIIENVGDTLTLVAKSCWVIKLHPTVVLAFINIPSWTTASFIAWNIVRRRLTKGHDERLIREGCFRAKILGSMYATTFLKRLANCVGFLATTSILHCDRTSRDNIEQWAWMIVPGTHFAGRKAYRPERD